MPEEILNLSTVVERTPINIVSKRFPKGKLYFLRNLADIGPYEYAAIVLADNEVKKLRALKKMTPAQKRLAEKLLDDTVRFVCMDIEPGVLAALTEQQKETIVYAWSEHVAAQGAAEGNARPNRKARRTTGASSPGFRSSTGATRKRGSTSRRGS